MRSLPPRPDSVVHAAFAEQLVLALRAGNRVRRIGAEEHVAHHARWGRDDLVRVTAVVDVAHDDAELPPYLRRSGTKPWPRGARNVRPGRPVRRLLPLERKRDAAEAVDICNRGCQCDQRPVLDRGEIAQLDSPRRGVVRIGDRVRRPGDDLLDHAGAIGVGAHHANDEAHLVVARREGRTGCIDDVDEDTCARVFLHLPLERDRTSDAVGIGDQAGRDAQHLIFGRCEHGFSGRIVENLELTLRLRVGAAQGDGLIRELQTLDVGETVAALGADVIGDDDRAILQLHDGVVGECA